MGKNGFLEKQKATQRAYFEAGLQMGRQQILDMMSLVLRDPDIVGKDIFGSERLLRVVDGIKRYIDKYNLAWQRHDETDYWQVKLDEALAEAYGVGMHDTFATRYEYLPDYDYMKGKWSR